MARVECARKHVRIWMCTMTAAEKTPYRMSELLSAEHVPIFIVEGEEVADKLAARGLVATTSSGGANGWTDDLVPYFKDKTVYILPDNDDPGHAFAERVASSIYGVAESVRICKLPDLPEKGDVSDWLKSGGDAGALVDICSSFPLWRRYPNIFSAAELQLMELRRSEHIVEGLIQIGLTLFAGKPKTGKSWAMLALAIALATGGTAFGYFQCRQMSVLYAALEDTPERLKDRVEQLLGDADWPTQLTFTTQLRAFDKAGLQELKSILQELGVEVLIVDVLERVRPHRRGSDGDYSQDYRSLSDLHSLANELGIAIVVVHHMRKADSDDVLDSVSGTTGLTGAADAVLALVRSGDGVATLAGRGRDLEEFEHQMKFRDGRWTVEGGMPAPTPDQQRIIQALESSTEPMAPKAIAAATGLAEGSVRKLLRRLRDRDAISQPERGLYAAKPSLCHADEKTMNVQRVME